MNVQKIQHAASDHIRDLALLPGADDRDDDFFIAGITPPTPQYPVYGRSVAADACQTEMRSPAADIFGVNTIAAATSVRSEPAMQKQSSMVGHANKRSVSFGQVEVRIFDKSLAADGSVPEEPADAGTLSNLLGIASGALDFMGEVWHALRQPIDSDSPDAALGAPGGHKE